MTPQFHFSPVSLIKHHILHILQLQVHLFDNVHETTGGTDDSEGEKRSDQDYNIPYMDGKKRYQLALQQKHSHVGVFMKSSKLIVHSGEEQRHLH